MWQSMEHLPKFYNRLLVVKNGNEIQTVTLSTKCQSLLLR